MKKFRINLQPTLNKLLLGVGISVFLTSAVGAVQANNNSSQKSDRPILLAQSNYCQDGESMFVSAETSGFRVNICGGDAPYTYVGVSKRNGSSIRVPLQKYSSEEFIAVNGDVRYRLTRSRLVVKQGRRTLVNQAVTRWN